ncbi:alpha/beta fold hydrolase [Streptomyces sp. 900116325]
MRSAQVTPGGARFRWVAIPGGPRRPRIYLHGFGASSSPYFAAVAVHPAVAGSRSLQIDMLGFGISDRPTNFGYTLEGHTDTLAAALETAGVQGAEVVGHSKGGAGCRPAGPSPPPPGVRPGPRRPHRPRTRHDGLTWHRRLHRRRVPRRGMGGGPRSRRSALVVHDAAAGLEALHRSAVHLVRGTEPTIRELLLNVTIPRTCMRSEDDEPFAAETQLVDAGVAIVPIPNCGHNIMLDDADAFARETARALQGT